MKKIVLTSTGLENKNIKKEFLKLLDKNPEETTALFITTAAVEPDAIEVLPKCLEDLLSCGIKKQNIKVYDMHKLLKIEELKKYDVVYVCGGKTSYLVERIKELKFKPILDEYIKSGGIYLGVSAGSVAASGTYKEGLNFIENELDVHGLNGSQSEDLKTNKKITLTDKQAILITDEKRIIIE